MKELCVLVSFVFMSEAIVVRKFGSADAINNDKQLITQETQVKRSAYGDYYPEDNYGYGYDHHGIDHHHHDHGIDHHHHHYDPFKALLVPLAGVALLGAAAIFASNPVLLQLGVIQGKRRRRGVGEKQLQDLLMLEKFISQLPSAEVEQQNQLMLASYLGCSGGCVQRVACEVQRHGAPEDMQVLDLIISEILSNEYVDDNVKKSVTKARKVGQGNGSCKRYSCVDLDKMRKIVKQNNT